MFYEKEVKDKLSDPSKPLTLVDMNKRFIASMSAFLRKKENTDYEFKTLNEMQQQQQQQQKSKPPAITKEEIEMERKSKFERELERKQNDFVKTISKPVPPVPKFQDDIDDIDKPINLEEEMKKIVTQRQLDTIPIPSTINVAGLDVEVQNEIKENNKSEIKMDVPEWLKSTETKNNMNIKTRGEQPVGYVKIGEDIEPFDINKYNSRHEVIKNQNNDNSMIINNLSSILKNGIIKQKNISWSDEQEKETQKVTKLNNDYNSMDKFVDNNVNENFTIRQMISRIETLEMEVKQLKTKMLSM